MRTLAALLILGHGIALAQTPQDRARLIEIMVDRPPPVLGSKRLAVWQRAIQGTVERTYPSEREALTKRLLARKAGTTLMADYRRQYVLNRLGCADGARAMARRLLAATAKDAPAVASLLRAFDGLGEDRTRLTILWGVSLKVLKRQAITRCYLAAMIRMANASCGSQRLVRAGLDAHLEHATPADRRALVLAASEMRSCCTAGFLARAIERLDAGPASDDALVRAAERMIADEDFRGVNQLVARLVTDDVLRRQDLIDGLQRVTGLPHRELIEWHGWRAARPEHDRAGWARRYARGFTVHRCAVGSNVTFGGSYPQIELSFSCRSKPQYITLVWYGLSSKRKIFRAERTYLRPPIGPRHTVIAAYKKEWVEQHGTLIAGRVEFWYGPRKERHFMLAVETDPQRTRTRRADWYVSGIDDPTDRLGFYRGGHRFVRRDELKRVKRKYWQSR